MGEAKGVPGRRNLQLPTSLTSGRGRYRCGFDLCLSPTRSLDVEGLQTAQHRGTRSGRSRQAVDSAWKDVGNCKPALLSGFGVVGPSVPLRRKLDRLALALDGHLAEQQRL